MKSRKQQGQKVYNLDGDRLRRLRERRGWSQYDLAYRTGLSRSFLAGIEGGSKRVRRLAAEQIADALSVSVEYLIRNGEDQDDREPVTARP